MKKNIKQVILTAFALPMMVFGASVVTTALQPVADVHAADIGNISDGASSAKGKGQQEQLIGDNGVFKKISDIMLFLIGAISVIMLIIGGIRYVVSGGDSTAVQSAKNTILYAIVGVIVALLAYAVVGFVTTNFSAGS